MNCTIPAAIISLLLAGPAPHRSLSDRADLTLTLTEDGSVASVGLNGHELPRVGHGGFYLREPNSPTRVPLRGRFFRRDGLSQLTATSPLKASLRTSWTQGDGYIEIRGELTNLADRDRGLWLGFNVPLDATGWRWGKSLSSSPVITSNQPAYAEDNNLVPIPAIWNEHGGVAICIPPTNPCVFEVGADSTGLRIEMAFGLSKDTAKFPSKAPFRLRLYSIDGDWGFRDALAKYYDWYPEYYSIEPSVMTAMDHHHDWIGVNYVSDQTEEKTDHLIDASKRMFMAYTKTSGRIQGLKDVAAMTTQRRVLDAIASTDTVQHYIKDAPADSKEIRAGRESLLNSACHRPDETILTILKPRTGEIDFPINCDPDLFSDRAAPVFGRHFVEKVSRIHARGCYNSVHWDRVGGWGNSLNYRRKHFAYIDHPLTFDQEGRVCIHTKLTHYELFDALRRQAQDLAISLSDPVSKYIPEFAAMKVVVLEPAANSSQSDLRKSSKQKSSKQKLKTEVPKHRLVPVDTPMTIHHLLTHTSGLMSGGLGSAVNPVMRTIDDTLETYVAKLAKVPLDFQPGTRWAYGNAGIHAVVPRIIEIVSETPFEEFVQERVLNPLEMNNSYFSLPSDKESKRVVVMFKGQEVKKKNGGTGLSSTAEDYLHFQQMLLDGGEFFGKRLLRPESVEMMSSNQVGDLFTSGKKGQKGMGFGYTVAVTLDPDVVANHRGKGAFGWGVGGTMSWTDPENELVAVIMLQQPRGSMQRDFAKAIQEAIVE